MAGPSDVSFTETPPKLANNVAKERSTNPENKHCKFTEKGVDYSMFTPKKVIRTHFITRLGPS